MRLVFLCGTLLVLGCGGPFSYVLPSFTGWGYTRPR
jgi:hypothetical protein